MTFATCRDCGHLSHPRSRCAGYANCGCTKAAPERWEVEPGRTLTYGGVPVFTVTGHSDHRGYRYIPAALDDLTREIAAALNARGVDGKDAIRD